MTVLAGSFDEACWTGSGRGRVEVEVEVEVEEDFEDIRWGGRRVELRLATADLSLAGGKTGWVKVV